MVVEVTDVSKALTDVRTTAQSFGGFVENLSSSGDAQQQRATVSLVGRRCSVSGNHVKATTAGFRSYHFHGMPGPFIGNVSHAGNLGRPAEFPAPEASFNMIA